MLVIVQVYLQLTFNDKQIDDQELFSVDAWWSIVVSWNYFIRCISSKSGLFIGIPDRLQWILIPGSQSVEQRQINKSINSLPTVIQLLLYFSSCLVSQFQSTASRFTQFSSSHIDSNEECGINHSVHLRPSASNIFGHSLRELPIGALVLLLLLLLTGSVFNI